jgi:hypothetical protein
MKYYRCYLLTAEDHIASARILKCADNEDAKRQCDQVVAADTRFAGAEIWDGAHRLYRCPEDLEDLARRRRKDDAAADDNVRTYSVGGSSAQWDRKRQDADAVRTAHLREERLEKAAELRYEKSRPRRPE